MAVSARDRKRQQIDRERQRNEGVSKELLKALEAMPPELAADCKMWIAPPGPNQERPTINWDIGAETHALMSAHADAYGVTMDEVLREIGVQYCIRRPDIYWAMKAAKINIIPNN